MDIKKLSGKLKIPDSPNWTQTVPIEAQFNGKLIFFEESVF